jgi:hypothetical protein
MKAKKAQWIIYAQEADKSGVPNEVASRPEMDFSSNQNVTDGIEGQHDFDWVRHILYNCRYIWFLG